MDPASLDRSVSTSERLIHGLAVGRFAKSIRFRSFLGSPLSKPSADLLFAYENCRRVGIDWEHLEGVKSGAVGGPSGSNLDLHLG